MRQAAARGGRRPRPIALVTGANRGIGLATVRRLAALAETVILTARDPTHGRAAVATLAGVAGTVVFQPLDVTDEASVHAARDAVRARYGRLDILINNAGVYLDRGGVLDTPASTIERTLAVNLVGALRVMQAFAPMMCTHRYGRIVNVSSGMGTLSDMGAGAPAYRLSKTALNALTVTAARELAPFNVLVNAACPGWVATRLTGFPPAARTPDEAADTIVWLATLDDGGPSGKIFRDRMAIAW